MGFLEDIGRAKAITRPLKAVSDLESAAVAREATETELKVKQFALQKAETEEAKGNELISANALKGLIPGADDDQVKHLSSLAASQGFLEADGSMRRKNIKKFQDFFNTDAGRVAGVENATIGLNNTRSQIEQLNKVIASGELKDKEAQQTQAQLQQLVKKENVLINTLDKLGIEKEKPVKTFEAEDVAERISRELFGAGFDTLNQTQQAVVNERVRTESEKKSALLGGITPTVRTQIQKDIVAGEKTIGELEQMSQLYNREFLEFTGRGKAALQSFLDKAGFPEALGKTPREFLKKKSAFVAQSKTFQNAYRKWVTGVAGGEKEFAEILRAIPDVDRDAPEVFPAKLEQTLRWSNIVTEWLKEKNLGKPTTISEVQQNLIDRGVIGSINEGLTPEQEADKFLRGE